MNSVDYDGKPWAAWQFARAEAHDLMAAHFEALAYAASIDPFYDPDERQLSEAHCLDRAFDYHAMAREVRAEVIAQRARKTA